MTPFQQKEFNGLLKMTLQDRGLLIASHKNNLENYFDCDLVIHKYGEQPNNENKMLPFKNIHSRASELINIAEFAPRLKGNNQQNQLT